MNAASPDTWRLRPARVAGARRPAAPANPSWAARPKSHAWIWIVLLFAGPPSGALAAQTSPRAGADASETRVLQTSMPSLDALAAPVLPDASLLQTIERDAPRVRAGQAALQAAREQAHALRAGPQEFTGRAQAQSRRIEAGPDAGRYTEWQLLLERPLRWPAQARADGQLAGATENLAAVGSGDAAHETQRLLLQQWFEAQRGAAQAQLSTASAALVRTQRDAMVKREQAGDASRLELELAQAEFAREQAQAMLAVGQAEASRQALLARFPAAAGAFAAATRSPVAPQQPDTAARSGFQETDPQAFEKLYVQRSHELALARADWQRAQALAEKAAAMRAPEPTVGVYVGSERGGNERIVGLQFAMPFGGPSRSAQHQAALAEAQAAEWRLRDVEDRLRADFRSQWAQAQAQAAGAQALATASAAQHQAATRMQRAYALGEASFSDWLAARRTALQTLRDALAARYDVAYASARLQLDAETLWGDMGGGHQH